MAKRVPPLTAVGFARLKPDPDRTIEVVDGAVPGLRLRVTPAGTRTWSLNMRARGIMRRFDVGTGLGLAEARQKAEALRRRITEGADPTEEKRSRRTEAVLARQGIGTFEAVIASYFEEGAGSALKSKKEQVKRIKSVFAPHMAKPALAITSTDLQYTIDRHPAEVTAGRATAYLRPVIRWAARRGLMHGAFDLEKPLTPPAVQRVLATQELARLLPTWTDHYGHCCLFLLLTGARLGEARSARWGDVDLEAGTWTLLADQRKDTRAPSRRRAETRDAFVIPLSRQAVTLLADVRQAELARRNVCELTAEITPEDFVFVGSRGGQLVNWDRWLKVSARTTGVSGWSAHALRRTTATITGDLGVPPHVVSVILGHTNIGGQLVAGYNKSRYRDEHRAALQLVADFVDGLPDFQES